MQILLNIHFLQERFDVDPVDSSPVESLLCSDSEPINVNTLVSYIIYFALLFSGNLFEPSCYRHTNHVQTRKSTWTPICYPMY